MTVVGQIETAVKAADYIAQQTLAWMLVALLLAVGGAGTWFIKYLINKDDRRAARDETLIQQIIKAQVEGTEVVRHNSEVIAHNSEVINDNTALLRDMRENHRGK